MLNLTNLSGLNYTDINMIRAETIVKLVHYNYDLYIAANFWFLFAAFLESKFNFISKRTGIESDYLINSISISLLIFNACMFLFQFLVIPLSI